MGGKVKKFKASASGGHVVVSKSNFAIALAPYFFPLYAVLVVLVFLAGHWLWNWQHYLVWFHLLLGAAYAFHVTLTWHILKHSQTDISEQGYFFSAVIIFLGNVAVLLVGIPLLVSQGGGADGAGLVAGDAPVRRCSAWGGCCEPNANRPACLVEAVE